MDYESHILFDISHTVPQGPMVSEELTQYK